MIDLCLLLVGGGALIASLFTVAKSYRDPWRLLLLCLPLLVVLTPGFGDAPAVRVEELVVFLLAPLIIVRRPLYRLARIELFFLLYGIAIVLSILVGFVQDGTLFFRDWFEVLRLAKYWLIVRLAISLPWSQDKIGDAIRVLLLTGLVGACIAIAQSLDSFGINRLITPLFIDEFRLVSVQRQVAGTIQNYNLFGTYLAMTATVAFSVLLFGKSGRGSPAPTQQKIVTAAILLAVLVALTKTTSKGSILALILCLLLLWLLKIIFDRRRRTAHAFMLLATLAVVVIVGRAVLVAPSALADTTLSRAATTDLASRFQISGLQRSLELRVADWQIALDLASQSLLFGSGPSKDEDIRAFHSEYLTNLRRYGLFGLTAYLLLLGTGALRSIELLRRDVTGERYSRPLLAGALGMICVFAVTSAIYQVFQQLQLAAILWWFVGIASAHRTQVGRIPIEVSPGEDVCPE